MKTFVRLAALLVAVAALCQAGLALAEDIQMISGGSQAAANDGAAAVKTSGDCAICDQSCDSGCGCSFGGCDCDPPMGIVGSFGFDSFKGTCDEDWPSNFGAVMGINAALPVPGLSDYGIGWQLGMSYGVYDFDGRASSSNQAESQQQTFVTTGFYRKAREGQRFSAGIVYDWMLNQNWGEYATAPTLGQWRGQVEYSLNECNGIGVYGCLRDKLARWEDTTYAYTMRSISQVDLFWHHKFCSGADSRLWFGIPEQRRVYSDYSDYGSLGDWIIGANIEVPISERLALYGNAEYMHPSEAAGSQASYEATWNVGAGVVWYFGGHAVSHSLNGKCWLPYLPVANNSTFLVDQGYNY